MAKLAPVQNRYETVPATPKSFAGTKRWISQLFFSELNKHSSDEEGNLKTNGQLMVENVVRLATDSTGDPYVQLAAAKFISERMEGKAAAMQDENHEEMPQIVICVGDATVGQIKKTIKDNEGAEPKEDILATISDEDGGNSSEYIL